MTAGVLFLGMVVLNGFSVDSVTPSFQRAETLAALSAVGLMLMAVLLNQANPLKAKQQDLEGSQGFVLVEGLRESVRQELGWGSDLILTATPAATILVYWDKRVILRRGILGTGNFEPGPICKRSTDTGKLISLVKTTLFPGRKEFDSIVKELPAVIVYPLNTRGWVVVGGWSERCFSRSDERWLIGWSDRLKTQLMENSPALDPYSES